MLNCKEITIQTAFHYFTLRHAIYDIVFVGKYHDKNVNYNTSVMTFWPQLYNDTVKKWQSTPENLLQLFQLSDKFPVKSVEELLKLMGLGDIATVMDHLLHEKLVHVDLKQENKYLKNGGLVPPIFLRKKCSFNLYN